MRVPSAVQKGQQGASKGLVAQQIIKSGDATLAAYDTLRAQQAKDKFVQFKKLGQINTFGIEVVNAGVAAQQVVLFDSYGLAAAAGYATGADITVTTTQGADYDIFVEMLKSKCVFSGNVDYQTSVSELQFKQPFKMVTFNVDGSDLPVILGNLITKAESPNQYNPKLLKLDLYTFLDGSVCLIFNVRAGETVNLTFDCLYQHKLS